jgi:hypothetical protein
LLENLKKTFSRWGYWKENFRGYLFAGGIQTKLVHETFFLKDYEISSNFYVFGKETSAEMEADFLKFVKESRKFIEIPSDHFLSCLVLIFLSKEKNESLIEKFYREKFLWFGIRGKLVFVGGVFDGKTLKFPKDVKDKNVLKFLNFLKASIESSL